MCKLLCSEPFLLRPWEVAQLTPLQVKHLYLCERDEHGRPILTGTPSGPPKTDEERFYRHWQLQGLRDDQIAKLWEEQKVKDAKHGGAE